MDQIDRDGNLVRDVDTRLSEREKEHILLDALPGGHAERYAAVQVVRYHDQVILKKQVTHLGFPWPEFKKRIQIPKTWLEVHRQALSDGLIPRFVGIYHYEDVTVFVDFEPSTYVRRKANNSAAHVSTNDLHQAQQLGEFSRTDANGNRITSIRGDLFAEYLVRGFTRRDPHIEVFSRFNEHFLTGESTVALDAVREMHAAQWPDRFQGEWAGFYLEYRVDSFVRANRLTHLVEFRKEKRAGNFDYDLALNDSGGVAFYGDLKASTLASRESPGNDALDLKRCIDQYGKFWYVIYEHDTKLAKHSGDAATIEWNNWKQSVGFTRAKGFDELSYAARFKESVRFCKMMVLEVNAANFSTVLGDFHQGQQPDGAERALKVMIKKRNIDNFLIYSYDMHQS